MKLLKTLFYPKFGLLFLATSVSLIGSVALNWAFQAHLLAVSGSESLLGLNNLAFYSAMMISLVIGGPLGDSFSKKKLLLISEVACIPLSLLMLFC